MITEKNTIKIRTEYTPEARKELNEPSRKTSNKIIFGALGFGILFVFFTFVFYYFEKTDLSSIMFAFFVFSMLVLLFGAMMKQSIKKNLQKSMPRTIYEYEFYKGGIAAKEEVEGEVLHVSKYYDGAICKTLDGKRYMFLYVSSSLALVIDKTLLSPEELATLKAIYFKEYAGDRIKLADFKPGTPHFVSTEETMEEKQTQ